MKKTNAYADAVRRGAVKPKPKPQPSGETCKRCGKGLTDVELAQSIFCFSCTRDLKQSGLGITVSTGTTDSNEDFDFGF